MNVSRAWLEAFLRRPLEAPEVAARLAMLGAPVDAIEPVGADLGAFVVGHVTDVRPHPDADKLRITTVDDGTGTLHQVVCGAPNVMAGGRYPFARLGTVMPGGLVIEKRKIRGEASSGMLCSSRELGLGTDHDGLLTLDTDAAPGTPITDILGRGDERLVVDVTPNRPDLLGHKGVARELAAALDVPFRLPQVPGLELVDVPPPARAGARGRAGSVEIVIDDPEGCTRFLGATIRGVAIRPSPPWLRERLEAVGVRSINNVVDITNYVMFELNQPMHAYDATTLRGGMIGVRRTTGGEQVVTLDGVTRTMPAGGLAIVDGERVIGVAGVMGGEATEVGDATTDIFLECAAFNPSRVRATRRALGLSTDASHRFERGTDRWGAIDAFRRAVALITTIAGGTVEGESVDCSPVTLHPPRIFLRLARVRQVLGIDLDWREIERCLVAIGATVVSKPDDARIAVDAPGWRPDITAEIDLIEEVARIHGYDAIPVEVRAHRPVARPDDAGWHAAATMRTALVGMGLSEAMTLPMVASGDDTAQAVLNPLSRDHGFLRRALVPSLVREVEANWAAHVGDVRLFEVGTVFRVGDRGPRPEESLHAAFVVSGQRHRPHWATTTASWDRWDAKGLFERLVALAQPAATVQVEGDRWVATAPDGRVVGWAGEVAADAPPWAAALYAGEVEVIGSVHPHVRFRSPPAYPAVARDLALLVAVDRPVASLQEFLVTRGARYGLDSVEVVDEYRGKGIPDGRRSVALRLVFRRDDRTLTDAEVEQALGRLVGMLEREHDVTLRSS